MLPSPAVVVNIMWEALCTGTVKQPRIYSTCTMVQSCAYQGLWIAGCAAIMNRDSIQKEAKWQESHRMALTSRCIA